jgi:hypothetical protein
MLRLGRDKINRMNTPTAPHPPSSLRTIFHRIWGIVWGYGKLPPWAVLLVILFGGSTMQCATTRIGKNQPSDGSMKVVRRCQSILAPLFFPPVSTSLASGIYVEVENTSNWTIPNLKAVLESENAKIQSCEFKTAAKLSSPAQETNDTTYVMSIATLLPGERLQLYCLTDNPQQVSVALNSVDNAGKDIAYAKDSFIRSTAASEQSGFIDFLEVIAAFLIIAVAACVIYMIVGLTEKCAQKLRLFTK